MQSVLRLAPVLLLLETALVGCHQSAEPPRSAAPVTAGPNQVMLEVPGMV